MISDADKKWIDETSYQGLLQRWRYSPAGDPIFTGETGAYYQKVMYEKRAAVGHEAAVRASKAIDG